MAYAGAPDGSYAQYYLGNDMIVAPVVTPINKFIILSISHSLIYFIYFSFF